MPSTNMARESWIYTRASRSSNPDDNEPTHLLPEIAPPAAVVPWTLASIHKHRNLVVKLMVILACALVGVLVLASDVHHQSVDLSPAASGFTSFPTRSSLVAAPINTSDAPPANTPPKPATSLGSAATSRPDEPHPNATASRRDKTSSLGKGRWSSQLPLWTPAAGQNSTSPPEGAETAVHTIPDILESADMGVQHARLWGPWQWEVIQVQLWFKLMCDSSAPGGMWLRGFAVAEPLREIPFYVSHPILPESVRKNLPTIHLLHTSPSHSPVAATNYYKEWVHRNWVNVWHFQARIPADISPHMVGLGIPGWSTVAPISMVPSCPTGPLAGDGDSSGSAEMQVDATPADELASTEQVSPQPTLVHQAWQTPGTIWGVLTPTYGRTSQEHAFLLLKYLQHHRRLGVTGIVQFMLSSSSCRELLAHPGISEAVQQGHLVLWLWDGMSLEKKLYYLQTHVINAAILAGWGHDLHLIVSDLDEYLVMVKDDNLPAALAPGGCLHGVSQIRLDRFDSVLDVPGHDGDLPYWMMNDDPCHTILLQHLDMGPTDPWHTPWKSIVNPDEVVLYHSHNGDVLDMWSLAPEAERPQAPAAAAAHQSQHVRKSLGRTRPLLPALLEAAAENGSQLQQSNTTVDELSSQNNRSDAADASNGATTANDNSSSSRVVAPKPRQPPRDERYTDRSCAYIMHFINLFRVRRPIDGPMEQPVDRTKDYASLLAACRARHGPQPDPRSKKPGNIAGIDATQ